METLWHISDKEIKHHTYQHYYKTFSDVVYVIIILNLQYY